MEEKTQAPTGWHCGKTPCLAHETTGGRNPHGEERQGAFPTTARLPAGRGRSPAAITRLTACGDPPREIAHEMRQNTPAHVFVRIRTALLIPISERPGTREVDHMKISGPTRDFLYYW
ncbi:hypothetical protein [Actinokineospora sp. NPDC004072]